MTDLTLAQATAAGYYLSTPAESVGPGGTGFLVRMSRNMTGQPGASGGRFQAMFYHASSYSAATTACLAALNGQRKVRYGAGAAAGHGGYPDQAALTFDVS